ncbi:hypothetical protein CFAM422_004969 [Trichoderma lentiforme]|uniref:Mitochondrial division protein 1 n=1 Tax=Trichoderma lentiforme TaxID=1567552 RepID=A0A9P4XIE9_9HYPO|nr:hypothetical protein CFAM422_004969 [Trichoderma lentiforme]
MSQYSGGETIATATGNVLSGSGMQINAPIAAINQYFKDSESEEALCLRDLYITDPRLDKQRTEDAKGGLLRESYSWILTQDVFSRWRNDPDARLLWIKGSLGTGKTMLLCGIVQELQHNIDQQDCLSFFFCEAGNKNADNAAAVLRGMIYLIINQQPKLIGSVIEKHKKVGSKLFQGPGAWYALREIFLNLLSDLRRELGQGVAYFVLDAPDECGEDAEKLLSLVSEASNLPGVKWLVASRRRADVAKHLEVRKAGRQGLDLDDCTEELTHAVKAYIDRCASDLAAHTGNDDLRQQISQGLQDKAIATFQYVTLVVAKLKAASPSEMLDVLREAALDMEGLYRQASDRIQHLDRETRHLCCSVLATVAITHRPLNREELYALAGLPLNGVAEGIIRKCDSFGIRGLTTFSVNKLAREFLYGDSVLFPEGFENDHRRIFLRSLIIMEATLHRDMYTLRQPGILAVDIKTPEPDPLAVAGYAGEYWIEHLVASNYHGRDTKDGGALSAFLEFKYLYWMESLSLLGVMRTALSSWTKLVNYLQGKDGAQQLAKLVVDAQRFIEYNGQSIMEHPLQAYASATVFVPFGSFMRELVRAEEPKWVTVHAEMREEHWSPWAQTLDPGNANLEVVGPVAFSPDGAWLAAALEGDYDGETVRQVQVWDMLTGNSVWTLEDASGWVAFPPKHTILGTVTSPGVVKFWDLTKGIWHHRAITPLNVSAAVFSPDGIWLAAADGGCIGIWDWARGDRALQFRHDSASPCDSVVYSAGGTRLASAHRDEIRVWNAQSGSLLRCIDTEDTTSVAFLPDTAGSRLISASNKSLITWSAETGERLGMLDVPSEEDPYSAMALSADGSRFVVAPDGNIMAWDTTTRRRLQTICGYDQHIQSLIFSPDGSQIASVSEWGLRLYRITSTDGEVFRAARDHPDKINLIRISANGNTMASASTSMMNIWDLTGAHRPREVNDTYSGILDMAFSPDSTRLVSVSSHQDAAIWDVETGNRLQTIPYLGFAVCFSPDGAKIALLEPAGTIRVWSLVEQRCLQSFQQATRGEFGSGSVAFGPDDMILTSFDRTIRIWKLLRRQCNLMIDDEATATALVFSSDGRQFAASYTDKIKIWDSKSGCCLQTLDTGRSNITVVTFDAATFRLLTNVGLVLLDEVPAGHADVRRELHRQGYGVNVTGDWVMWDSEKVLWLPPAYRPDSIAGILPGPEASTLSAIVLGCRSGRVVVLRFPTGLPPHLS